MAEIGWSRARPRAAAPVPESAWERVASRVVNWEDLLTLGIAAAATVTVSYGLQSSGWSTEMPDLAIVSIVALLSAMLMARSRMSVFSAWPFAILLGALVTLWQTLEAVGPGTLEMRLDAIYHRFNTWFHIAFTDGVSNDSLPFNTLVVGLTWLGTFLFGWSVFRWHHAWVGLIPGGAALFIGIVFVTDSLATAVAMYVLFGFLLVMRTNLTKRMDEWRRTNVEYPALISLSFLHLTTWALLGLLVAAWVIPVGPYATPGVVDSLVRRFEGAGIDFVRLAGPLHVDKVIPVHSYTGVLPFQGSVDLGERELLLVEVQDPTIAGPIALRGTVYEEYGSGGWTAGGRDDIDVTDGTNERLTASIEEALESGEVDGRLIPLEITLQAKSVVGTVLFAPGQAIGSEPTVDFQAPAGSVVQITPVVFENKGRFVDQGRRLSDDEVIERFVPDWFTGTAVKRDDTGAVIGIEGFDNRDQTLPQVASLTPDDRVRRGGSYTVTGFVPIVTPDELRAAAEAYPRWISQYLALPDSLPHRVVARAVEVAGGESTAYDKAKTIETYLRTNYPIDYNLGETPAGKDTVDYFLFEARSGFFDYHASAMTVMLRAVGVPARLAVGFVVEDTDREPTGEFMVRDKNAYAWTEVYFSGYGWIPFNPSPDRPADLTPGEQQPPAIPGDNNGDTVVDIRDFPGLPVGADPIFPDDLAGIKDLDPGSIPGGGIPSSTSSTDYTPWILGAVAVIAVMIAGSAAMGWRRSVVGLPYAQATWEKTLRLASLAGHGPQPGQTPDEFARGLQKEFRGHRVISEISDAYSRSRFGRADVLESQRRSIERQWPHLRRALMGRVVARLLRRSSPSAN